MARLKTSLKPWSTAFFQSVVPTWDSLTCQICLPSSTSGSARR
ncbi:hypothetical protein [Kitasatospora fiedleri]|nr:hypothetical protein [Kitasatospora fiedleri]